jgi:hypothetical protein
MMRLRGGNMRGNTSSKTNKRLTKAGKNYFVQETEL